MGNCNTSDKDTEPSNLSPDELIQLQDKLEESKQDYHKLQQTNEQKLKDKNDLINSQLSRISALENELKQEKTEYESKIKTLNDKLTSLNQENTYLLTSNRQNIQNKNSIIQSQFNKITELENELNRKKAYKLRQDQTQKVNEDQKKDEPTQQTLNPINFSIESKPDILVYGFINAIGDELQSLIIPKDIIRLCYLFYYQDMNLILLSGSKNCKAKQWNEGQFIKLYHIENQYEKYYINIQSVIDNSDPTLNDQFDKYNYGECISSHISLPLWNIIHKYSQIGNKNNKIGKYQCIFRCGGQYSMNDICTDTCDMILFNADSKISNDNENVMNGYYIQLPSIPSGHVNPSVVYDSISSTLYCVGGLLGGDTASKRVYDLKLNSIENTEWCFSQNLNKARYGSSLCMIKENNNNNIAVIGGRNGNYNDFGGGFSLSNVELISNDNNIICNDMNTGRYLCGSCYNNMNGNDIIVGGGMGYGAATSVEYIDLNKNKWISLKYETNYSHNTPFITYDIYNPNIIYIGSNSIGNHSFGTLGFIEWIDRRDSACKFWNFLFDKSIQVIFDLQNDIPITQTSIWRSRSLILS